MKKLVAVILTLVLALSVAACAAPAAEEPATTEGTEAPATTEGTEATTEGTEAPAIKVGFIMLHDENSTYDLNFINAAEAACEKLGVEYKIVEENTYGIVKEKIPEGKTTCSLCSRLRRGILYRTATELGATKIALGHHRDDILQTLFLNMFYGGKMKGMPPKLMSDDGKHIVIRPLPYSREKDIQRFADAKAFPIIPCNLCGSQPNLQRQVIADMLRDWDKRYPGRIETMFSAMQNVVPSHLCDTNLFDFKGITHGSEVVNGGDLAFDREEIPLQPAGWQPEEDENQLDELRLNVVEVK